eukprot:SAG31_NODE_18258_length_642_cov_0.793738_1_plen_88_part_10
MVLSALVLCAISAASLMRADAIDRAAVVGRHDVRFVNARPVVGGEEFCTPNGSSSAFSQLTVGNGNFAATVDLTGLQSLNRSYGSSSD